MPRSALVLGLLVLIVSTPYSSAWELGGPLYTSRYPVPPRYFGYNLDDETAGYYGGGRYREYYGFGRGYGFADFPDSVPGFGYYAPRRLVQPAIVFPDGALPPPTVPRYGAPQVLTAPPAEDLPSAYFDVELPEDAELWIEEKPTQQTGRSRQFVTPALAPGNRYGYTLRARWSQEGHTVEQTQNISLLPGDHLKLQFPTPDTDPWTSSSGTASHP